MKWARLLADGSGSLLAALGVRVHVHGSEHLPEAQPAVIASNHVSYVDFAVIQAARPDRWPPLRFFARWDLVPPAVGHGVMRRLGLVPVDEARRPGASVAEGLRVISEGFSVGIHPEGRIHPDVIPLQGRSGAARLATTADVPLVPCSVWGTQRILTRGRRWPDLHDGVDVHVRFGRPLHAQGGIPRMTARLMDAIASLTRASAMEHHSHRPASSRCLEAGTEPSIRPSG